MDNILTPGTIRIGHVFDGEDDGFPAQAAVLEFFEDRGVEISIPYLGEHAQEENPQHYKSENWFRSQNAVLPSSFVFVDDRGVVVLSGLRMVRVTGGADGGNLARVRANVVIFGRPRTQRDVYPVREFMSWIDGLSEFAAFRPVDIEDKWDSAGRLETTVKFSTIEVCKWEFGGFRYKIQSNVSWRGDSSELEIIDSQPFISTEHPSTTSIEAHLEAQMPIRALLILIHGTTLAWRSHQIRDDEFQLRTVANTEVGSYPVDIQLARTVRDHYLPVPEIKDLIHSVFGLSHVGALGLQRWIELYDEPMFRRAVLPAVEVLNGATRFLEPQLMMLAISLDYFGYFRFGDSKQRGMNISIQKCLIDVGLDFSEVGSHQGIANAISTINNDIKHPDRERAPEHDVLAVITNLAKAIVRAQVLEFLGVEAAVSERFMSYGDGRRAVEYFLRNGITIEDDGTIVRS